MSKDFVIGNGSLFKHAKMDGILLKYRGNDTHVVIPDGVKIIENNAFKGNKNVTSIVIPGSIEKIYGGAFRDCESLTSVTILNGATYISSAAFSGCKSLASVTLPDSLKKIGENAFNGCTRLNHITIPDSVTIIGRQAFYGCTSLTSVNIPEGLKQIWQGAFMECTNLTTVVFGSNQLESFGTGPDPFELCNKVTIVCKEGCYIHRYCVENNISYIFDYQYEAFHGLLPQGFEMLSSPFLADEEKPNIFISYSHKDRDTILEIIKGLYEKGWRIWYDEGLTVGDSYDKTLYEHVENCSAFLLFITENSVNSNYIKINEIPWAKKFNKPIIKCIVNEGQDIEIGGASVIATVSSLEIEPALEKVGGLTKGEPREAKGISVVVDPANRDLVSEDGFAYCVYYEQNASPAKTVMLSVKNGGCNLYDAIEQGADREKLKDCACLVVFLDKSFLTDEGLTKLLIDAFQTKRDIAVCQMESIEDSNLPEELIALHRLHWLNFEHGISEDMNQRLIRHLEKRGCRNTAVIPGLEYEETDEGIIITRYTGLEPEPRIESEYNGKPVVKIAQSAFEGCVHMRSITIPDSVRIIRSSAFKGCTSLTSVVIPNSVTSIEDHVFSNCKNLISIAIPSSIERISAHLFEGCTGLSEIIIPETVKTIAGVAFKDCTGLTSIIIPDSVTEIGYNAFKDCTGLTCAAVPDILLGDGAFMGCKGLSDDDGFVIIRGELFSYYGNDSEVILPDSVRIIGKEVFRNNTALTSIVIPQNVERIKSSVFRGCTNLTSIVIPEGVTHIGFDVFSDCPKLTSVIIPKSVNRIENPIYERSPKLIVYSTPGSYAWNYCKQRNKPVKDSKKFSRRGLFGKKR